MTFEVADVFTALFFALLGADLAMIRIRAWRAGRNRRRSLR